MPVDGGDNRLVKGIVPQQRPARYVGVLLYLPIGLILGLSGARKQRNKFTQIRTGAKRLVSGSGDDGTAQVFVIPVVFPRRCKFYCQLRVNCIACFRSVQG